MGRLAALVASAGALSWPSLAAEKLPLCDEAIVKETCQLIGDGDTTSKSDVEEFTSATPEQCADLWRAFGYSEDRVDCTSLCYTVVGFLSQSGEMPAQSDTACYEVDGQDGNIRCDMDISQGSGAGEGIPDSDGEGEEDSRPHRPHGHGHKNTQTDGRDMTIDYDTQELSLKVANLFRIFPAPNPSFGVRRSAAGDEETGVVGRRLPGSEDFQTAAAEASAGAIADIAHAIRHVRDPRIEKYTRKWFGKNSPKQPFTRKEILRILNSVTHVMANAKYIHDHSPDGCDDDTYAWVMPDPDSDDCKDENGKFKVFLCDLFMAKPKERRETITHEASHHGTAFTDDVCAQSVMHYHKSKRNLKVLKLKSELDDPDVQYGDEVAVHWDGKVWDATVLQIRDHDEVILNIEPEEDCEELAYGRRECMTLARKAPLKALRNADSFCFFIQDLADHID